MAKNRLAEATSPYLLQHADNPVDWHQWGESALTLAKQENKPILLSIGYSACHWCHVMAHESFEDEATAALMNQLFVNIKVDREERPDLDNIYQSAHQLLSQRPGGWPLTVFLTPDDQSPFFAGTYFPLQPRHGLPAFKDLLRSIANAYHTQTEQIREQNLALQEALVKLNPGAANAEQTLDATPVDVAYHQLSGSFDELHGGFGRAPKFPHPESLAFLLRYWSRNKTDDKTDPRTLHLVDHTLTRMALAGINDQLGGGFYRYSTDDEWMIPHFEKMLYDNALLLSLYCDLWQATKKPLFRETALATAQWVMREMQSPAGGYYSSLDADSEGEEGRFYIWSTKQVAGLLTDDEYRHFACYYGLERSPNFEGSWHLHNFETIATLNDAFGTTGNKARELLRSAREKLFRARASRTRPGCDDKILTSWNALMIKGMAKAGRLLEREDLTASAEQSARFIRSELWHDGRLLATHRAGRSRLSGYLDDHAFLLDALLELLQTRWNPDDLEFAIALADLLIDRFRDRQDGGFFFTADDHEKLIHRSKPFSDNATPAGNGVAAHALLRLGHILGEERYISAAQETIQLGWSRIRHTPHAHCTLLSALEELLTPTEIIVIRANETELAQWKQRASNSYVPHRYTLAIPNTESNLPNPLAAHRVNGNACAYLCTGTHCESVLTDFSVFDKRLAATE